MRNKTIFKQMYLVDPITYNRINNTSTATTTTSTPTLIGKPNIQVSSHPTLNVAAPVTTEIPIPSTYPNSQSGTSVGTQSEVLNTKSVGNITNPPPTKEHVSSQTVFMNKGEEGLNVRNLQIKNFDSQINNHAAQSRQHSLRNTPYTFHYPSSTESRQYITPVSNSQKDITDISTHQNSLPVTQSESQMMEYASKIPIQYSPPSKDEMVHAKPFEIEAGRWLDAVAQQNNVVNSLNQDSDVVSLQHPQMMNYATAHSTLQEPQPMDIGNDNSFKALPAPASKTLPSPTPSADCEECSVTPYKKYDLSLPFPTGLPDNVIFTCTICQSNFGSKTKLQRHMKNIHDAFSQVEKGIKRKSKQEKKSVKKMKTSREVVPYSLYNLENLT